MQFAPHDFGGGMRKIIVTSPTSDTREYLVPHGKHLRVHSGDRVRAGFLTGDDA